MDDIHLSTVQIFQYLIIIGVERNRTMDIIYLRKLED